MTGDLSPRQEKFCLLYAETGRATEAYKQAYSNGEMGDNAAAASASKLLKNPKIQKRIREIRDEAAAPKIRSIIETKAFLSTVMDDPATATGTRVAAAKLLLQSQGALYKESAVEVNVNTGTDTIIYLPELDEPEEYEIDYIRRKSDEEK